MNKGTLYAIGAYVSWGLLPVYWKWLRQVPAPQLLGHRILWSFLALFAVICLSRKWHAFRVATLHPAIIRTYVFAAVLIAINWLTYVWAVNAGFILETSLGYFINPLLSVLMGVIFLGERLRPWQWAPIGLATAGVLYLTFAYGTVPWIALTLAFSFAFYALVKKRAPLGSLYGLTLETGILFLPALISLSYVELAGKGAFLHSGALVELLLIGAGLMTTFPLLLFAAAAQRIPLSLIGILQYIAPTLQFLLGVLVYHEPFTHAQSVGFSCVWIALILFSLESFLAYRARPVAVATE